MYGQREYYRDLERARDSGATVTTIGKSTLGRDIHLVTKGDMTHDIILLHAGIHAREYITTPLLLNLIREYSGRVGIAIVPSVNIDGMLITEYGLESIEDKSRREWLLRVNGGNPDFSLWKANANAVDLNVSFNANWGMGKSNVRHPAPENYIGEFPLQEVENRILAGITLKLQPKITLSYHTKGEVIYHGYRDNLAYRDIALEIADYLRYDLLESKDSYGGYKDWFMATTPYLGLTVECGSDNYTHPLPWSALDEMISRHSGLLDEVARLVREIE